MWSELTNDNWGDIVRVAITLSLFFRGQYWRRRFFDLRDGVQKNVARMERNG